jgi:ribosome-associated toxin RatA of RatAB toxin-antitoxin module
MKYSADKLYNVVSDVNRYKDFVPWCIDSRVLPSTPTKDTNIMEAELTVGYSLFKETYLSQVQLKKNESVIATSSQTHLFDQLKTTWQFQPGKDPNTCWVSFQLEFQFKSALYNKVSDIFFQDIVDNMVAAFEKRTAYVYSIRST